MSDDVAAIHKDPAAGGLSLDPRRLLPQLLAHVLGQSFGQGIQVSIARACGDDVVIGEGAQALNIQQHDIFSFFIFKRIHQRTGILERLQGTFSFESWAAGPRLHRNPSGFPMALQQVPSL